VIWFEPPERALADPIRFMAYAMTYATHRDMRVLRQYVSDGDLQEALNHAPPGIIDPRSSATGTSRWAAILRHHYRSDDSAEIRRDECPAASAPHPTPKQN
jgi:hypothetical protein